MAKIDDEVKNYCLANNATLQIQSSKTDEGIGMTDKAPLFVYLDMRNIKSRHFIFVQG